MFKAPKLIACALALSAVTTMVGFQCAAATKQSETGYSGQSSVSALATSSKTSSSASKPSKPSGAPGLMGDVTAIGGYKITLKVQAGKPPAKGSSSSSTTTTTKTVTLTKSTKIYKQSATKPTSSSSAPASTSAKLSDIKVGSHLMVAYDSKGNITSVTIMSGAPSAPPAGKSSSASSK